MQNNLKKVLGKTKRVATMMLYLYGYVKINEAEFIKIQNTIVTETIILKFDSQNKVTALTNNSFWGVTSLA